MMAAASSAQIQDGGDSNEAGSPAAPAPDSGIRGPRELLSLFGVDRSHWDRVRDGRPVHADEREVLLRLLYVIDRFPVAEVSRWAHRQRPYRQLFEEADPARGEFFALEGRVVRVLVHQPLPELARRFEFDRYYECRWIDSTGAEAVVFARNVPRAWLGSAPLDERASAWGLFVKVAGSGPDQPMPLFVADRVAWHPDTLLGRLGMDVGLLDTLKDDQRLTAEESECFYQMLFAASRAKPGQLRQEAQAALRQSEESRRRNDRSAGARANKTPADALLETDAKEPTATGYSVVPLFNAPAEVRGALVDLAGMTRSVLRVELGADDPQGIRARFGFDHYYQVSLFTPDSQGNPITVCVGDIPKGMPLGEGPQFSERIRVTGFFLKKWAYRIALPEETKPGTADEAGGGPMVRQQLAPMVMAGDLIWYPANQARPGGRSAGIAAIAVVAILVAFGAIAWRGSRRRTSLARRRAGDSAEGLPEKLPGWESLERPLPDDAPSGTHPEEGA